MGILANLYSSPSYVAIANDIYIAELTVYCILRGRIEGYNSSIATVLCKIGS